MKSFENIIYDESIRVTKNMKSQEQILTTKELFGEGVSHGVILQITKRWRLKIVTSSKRVILDAIRKRQAIVYQHSTKLVKKGQKIEWLVLSRKINHPKNPKLLVSSNKKILFEHIENQKSIIFKTENEFVLINSKEAQTESNHWFNVCPTKISSCNLLKFNKLQCYSK